MDQQNSTTGGPRRTAVSSSVDRYTVISADCHGGGAILDYRPYLPRDAPRRLRRLGRHVRQPVRRPRRRRRAAATGTATGASRELEADGIVAEVIFPNTIPPFFPQAVAGAPAAGGRRRRPRAALGGAAGPQPLARRLLRGGAGPAGRHRPDPAARRRRGRRRGPLGEGRRAHRRRAAARRAAGLGPAAAVRAGLRAVCGGVRGARPAGQPPHAAARRPTTATTPRPR